MDQGSNAWETEKRTEKIQIRLTPSELKMWREEAAKNAMKLSKFIRTQIARSLKEPRVNAINDEYVENLEQGYKEVETGLAKLKDLVDEFRNLFPSNRSRFFLE